MKYAFFTVAFVLGVPAMSFAAALSARLRGWLLTALIFSTTLGDVADIHFMSAEYYRGPDRGFGVNLTDLIAWALVIALLLRFPAKLRWAPYNSSWMFAFFGAACAAAWLAPERLLASFTLFKLVKMYVVFWCVVNCLRVGTERGYVWMGLVAIGAFIAVLAVKQRYLDGIVRVPGPFDHSNTIPSFLNLIVPVLLGWGLCDRRLTRAQTAISLIAVFGMIFAIVATLSRAGMALTVGCVVGMLMIANVRARSGRVMVTSLVIYTAILAGGVKAVDTVVERFQSAPLESAEAREEFNAAAAMMAHDHLFGVGLNNFSHVLTNISEYRQHIVVMAGEQQAGVAHHIYWLTAAEMGYPGLVVFVIVIGRFVWLAGRCAWRGGRSLEGLLLSGFFLGFCALHAVGFLEWTLRITPVSYLFTVSLGICVAFAEVVQQQLRPRSEASARQTLGGLERRFASGRIRLTNIDQSCS